MPTNDEILPKLTLNGEMISSDICVWCGSKGPLTSSHLFPKALGGRFAPRISCKECNDFLGRAVESELKKNIYLTAAMAKLGLASRKEAYRQSKKYDEETGVEIHLTEEGPARPVRKKTKDGSFIGTPEEIKKHVIDNFKKRFPNWPTKPLEDFYDDPVRRTLIYAGEKYVKRVYPGAKADIRMEGWEDSPNPNLVFKIAYEFLFTFDLCRDASIRNTLLSLVACDSAASSNRLSFSASIPQRISTYTIHDPKDFRYKEQMPYEPIHYVRIGHTKNAVLYLEVCFFKEVRCLFVIDRIENPDYSIKCLLDNVRVFPVVPDEEVLQVTEESCPKEWAEFNDRRVDSLYKALTSDSQ